MGAIKMTGKFRPRRFIIPATLFSLLSVIVLTGVANGKDDSDPSQPSGPRYRHSRDSAGHDRYGKLYTKRLKSDDKPHNKYSQYEVYNGNPLVPFLPTSTDYN
jgi:hypothetical protein